MHGDVDLGDFEPSHVLDGGDNVAANSLGQVVDRDPVIGHDPDVDGCLTFADLHQLLLRLVSISGHFCPAQ
ncbi:Uncharacterised protein [Mycobacteroides abscessus subsp. abscessus]|nr:Uncharacterised protein [Mycobacteroides abscessus subsp. abscessus]